MPQQKILFTGDKQSADAIYVFLNEIDTLGVTATSMFRRGETDEWLLELYFDECPDVDDFRQRLEQQVATELTGTQFEAVEIPEENWVVKVQKELAPVEAGVFLIHGSHDRETAANHPNPIEIDAGEAFGTAHHGTTSGCLEMVSKLVGPDHKTCLDLGTGSGILAIALARLLPPQATIVASDIDSVSVRVARENADKNAASDRIEFVSADGMSAIEITRHAPYDVIIANILAEPLISLADDIANATQKDSDLVLSGLLKEQANSVISAFRDAGFSLSSMLERGEWSTLHLIKNQ